MLILPAIYLLEGRAVRSEAGALEDPSVYSDDPLAVARSFAELGAAALHVVDVEGARLGRARNLNWIYRMREELGVTLQVAGGIETFALASRLLEAGIDRVVCPAADSQDLSLLRKLMDRLDGDRVAAAVDVARRSGAEVDLEGTLGELQAMGVPWIVYRESGPGGGPADSQGVDAVQPVEMGFRVIVSGGVCSVDDVRRVRELGAAGCVIGSALYDRTLSLSRALEVARGDAAGPDS